MKRDHADDDLLTPSQLAARFGYTAAAVSNWRRRHPDTFPSPDEDGRYRSQDVAAWLQQRQPAPRSRPEPMDQLLDLGRRSRAAQLAAAGMITAASRGSIPTDWRSWANQPSRLDAALGLPQGTLSPAAAAAADLAPQEIDELALAVLHLAPREYPAAFDALVDDRLAARASAEHVTTRDLTEEMVKLLPPRAESILDPACGQGGLLASALTVVRAERAVGVEIDPRAWAISVQRMAVHDLPASIELGDFFHDRRKDQRSLFDLVVAQPPLNQRIEEGSPLQQALEQWSMVRRRGSGDFAWLFGARSRLTEDGMAFVITSAGATLNTYDTEPRRELVRSGCVAAVLALPGGLIAGSSVPIALWVLRRSAGPSESILFVNAEQDLDQGIDAARRWLYTPKQYADERGLCQTVPILEALRGDAQLAPAKHTEARADPSASRQEAAQALRRLAEASKQLRATVIPVVQLRPGPSEELISLQSLEDAKKLTVQRPWHIPRSHLHDQGEVPYATRITDDGRLQVTGHLAGVPAKGAVVTRPGDVVLATIGSPRAVIDQDGGHVLGSSLWLIRPRGGDPRFSARVLTLLLASPRIATQAIGSTVRRLRSPADVSIPMLRTADAVALTEWIEAMDALHGDALRLAAATQDALRAVSAAVDAGASIDSRPR